MVLDAVPVDAMRVLPEIVMIAVATICVTAGFWVGRRALAGISLAGLALTTVLVLGQLDVLPGFGWLGGEGVAYTVHEVNAFGGVLKLVFLAVTILVVLASPAYWTARQNQGEYYGLLLFSTVGMMFVASARDLLTLFVAFELSSFASYVLAAYSKRDPASAEAGMKYFVMGAMSSAIVLFAISVLYALTGTIELSAIGQALAGETRGIEATPAFNPLAIFAVVFLVAGFGFKIAAFPFHMWAPDVYEGSPTTVSAFLAAGSKKMGFVALFKVFLIALLAVKANWIFLVGFLAIATMTIGNVLALRQESAKRMLAYSSIAHAGYMLIALPVAAAAAGADPALANYGAAGGIFHILTHAFMKAGAFLVIGALAICGIGEAIGDFRGLSRRAPFLALAMLVFMVSFAGIPPFAGFYSKFVLFSGAVDASLAIPGHEWLIALAIAGVLNSALSLYYYARVIRMMYVEEAPAESAPIVVPRAMTAAAAIAVAATVLFGIWPQPVLDLATRAAAALFVA